MSISVIIPIKNRAHLLKSTLDNILNQTYAPSEIIVVDDHSTDKLKELIDTYENKVILIPSSGVGPGAARNTGFLASTGKYIQFFDSDDLMTLDKLEVQYSQLESSASAMAYCPHVKAVEQEKGWKQTDSILYYKSLSKRFRYDQWVIRGACMITQSCLFKRELINEAGLWRTDLITHEDLEFLFRIGRVEPYPVHSSIPAVLYRQHEYQITDKNTTITSRADDQLKAFRLISEQTETENYNFFDRLIIENNIQHAAKYSSTPVHINAFQNLPNTLFGVLNRAVNKAERLLTKSNWRFVHGVNNDPEQFEQYVKKIHKI
jgi:glycosyltransferase involved in cell wall biosynthesis